jgi:hypothetical protein
MRRTLLLAAVMCLSEELFSEQPRDPVREAYRSWRETDPNLEREAAAGGAAIAQRADRMSAEAAKYAAARKAMLQSLAQDQAKQIARLENAAVPAEPAAASGEADSQFVISESAKVTRTINAFASDPDKGIQQLRAALEREREALTALAAGVSTRQKSVAALKAAANAIDTARSQALAEMRSMSEAAAAQVTDASQEAEAWAEYYRKIGEGARGDATPITVIPPGVPPALVNNPVPAPPTVTPLPLARYVGAWTFPTSNGLFHGAQPEFLDVVVFEENGQAKGTLLARFKLPPGSDGDPVLRFDFTGPFQASRNQIFNLTTTDGARGTIELIPGAAFNLLEVNFQTETKPGKVHQADVVLVKK